jgi:hypothetical protein
MLISISMPAILSLDCETWDIWGNKECYISTCLEPRLFVKVVPVDALACSNENHLPKKYGFFPPPQC